MGEHFVTTDQARRIDTMLRWFDRIGKRLRLTLPKAEGPSFGGGSVVHLGKLDSALSTTNSTGVRVTIWTTEVPPSATGEKLSSVTSSTLLTSGTFASGASVKVELIDGNLKVTGARCS